MSSPLRAYDETNRLIKNIKIDSDGHLQVDVLSGGGGGDASAANQTIMIGDLASINTELTTGTLTVDGSAVTQPVSGSVAVSSVTGTVAVSASTLPLPTGAATETSLASVASCVSGTALQVDIQADAVSLANQTKQDEIKAAIEDTAPSHVQSTLYSSSLVTSGAVSSQIDMQGQRHLTIFGKSDDFTTLALVMLESSGGVEYTGEMIFSNQDPVNSNHYFSQTIRDVGCRYVKIKNLDASSRTLDLYAVKSR